MCVGPLRLFVYPQTCRNILPQICVVTGITQYISVKSHPHRHLNFQDSGQNLLSFPRLKIVDGDLGTTTREGNQNTDIDRNALSIDLRGPTSYCCIAQNLRLFCKQSPQPGSGPTWSMASSVVCGSDNWQSPVSSSDTGSGTYWPGI